MTYRRSNLPRHTMKTSLYNSLIGIAVLFWLSSSQLTPAQPGQITAVPTLGGSDLQVNALNAAGTITGFSYTTNNAGAHPFVFGGGALADLGTLGGNVAQGWDLSSNGYVVGDSTLSGDVETHAFLHDGTLLLDLGTLGGSYSSAAGVNNVGQVVGSSLLAGDTTFEAFLYSGGGMLGLGTLGGEFSSGTAINQVGSVAGDAETALFENHAFLWSGGLMNDLGTLGGTYSSALALNDGNVVVGESDTSEGHTHAFIYTAGTMSDLGTFGGTYSSAYAVNNANQVIGVATTPDESTHGFIYSGGVVTDLGTLGGSDSFPEDINETGQVVGSAATATGLSHAFLWQNGTITDLNTLLPENSGWELLNARLINDSGRIVGYGLFEGAFRWFIFDLPTVNPPTNHPPVAVAGTNQSVECHAVVTLDGSQSSDPDGDPLTYEWSQDGNALGTDPTLLAVFEVGTYTITLKVTDSSGASSQANVVIQVVDTTSPVVSCPATITVSTDANCRATVPNILPRVTVSDNCTATGLLVISQDPAAGTVVGPGDHSIVVTASDASGNTASCRTVLRVSDTTPPVIVSSPNALTAAVGANCQAPVPNVLAEIVVTDNCTPKNLLSVTQNPPAGTLLAAGEYVVTVTVTDIAGNSASLNVPLTVADHTAPAIQSLSASPAELLPPNGDLIPVTVSVVASDNCDSAPVSAIVSITSNEPVGPSDIQITGSLTARLAASRNPSGGGRVYTITVRCSDASGNSSTGEVTVSVPKGNKDKGNKRKR